MVFRNIQMANEPQRERQCVAARTRQTFRLSLVMFATILAACQSPVAREGLTNPAGSKSAFGAPGSPTTASPALVPAVGPSPVPPSQTSQPALGALRGRVTIPLNLLGDRSNTLVSNAGSSVLVANGGLLLSKGAGLISNNGAGISGPQAFRIFANSSEQVSELPFEGVAVALLDAAGKPIKDRNGSAVVANTDKQGNYQFAEVPEGRSLVLSVTLPGQLGRLTAIAPRDLPKGSQTDIGYVSTLTSEYILDQYVQKQSDPNRALDKLPAAVDTATQTLARTALDASKVTAPSSLTPQDVVKTVEALRQSSAFSKQLDDVKRLLVAAGLSDLGSGMEATKVPLDGVNGIVASADGIYIYSGNDKRIWRVKDGRAITAAGNGLVNDRAEDQGGKPAQEARMYAVRCAVINPENELVYGDSYRVYAVTAEGKLRTLANLSAEAKLITPGPDESILVVDHSLTVTQLKANQAPRVLGTVAVKTKPRVWMVGTGAYNAVTGQLLIVDVENGSAKLYAFNPLSGTTTEVPVTTENGASSQTWALGSDGSLFTRKTFESPVERRAPDGTAKGTVPGLEQIVPHQPITVAPDDTLYQYSYNSVSRVTPDGPIVIAGVTDPSGVASVALTDPHGFALVGQTLYIADGSRLVRQDNASQELTAIAEGLDLPCRVAADAASRIYVLEGANESQGSGSQPGGHRIRRFEGSGADFVAYDTSGKTGNPRTIADFLSRPNGSLLLLEVEITGALNWSKQADATLTLSNLTTDGKREEIGRRSIVIKEGPWQQSLVLGGDGSIYSFGSEELVKWSENGDPTVMANNAILSHWTPSSSLMDERGRLLMVNHRGRLVRFDPVSNAVRVIAGPDGALLNGNTVDTSIANPAYLNVTPDGTLYMVDRSHRQIKKLSMKAVDAVQQ